MQKPSIILELNVFTEPYMDVFQEFFRLCKIAATIPVSTISYEWSFSSLTHIKTHLRSMIAGDRQIDLGSLPVEKSCALNLDEVANIFARNHKNWRM